MKPFLSDTTSSRQTITAAVFLSMIALVVYGNTFNAPFVYDDIINITGNPFIRMTDFTPDALSRVLKSRSTYRPLANFSFAVNYFFDGYDVRGYHAVNLIIHIITALLVFLVTRQSLRLMESENTLLSILAAALWLVHPLHTQSVTYIVQRMNSLATMFFMLALFCYIRARINAITGQSRFRRIALYLICFMAAVFGLVSKQTTAVLPIVLLLYEWFFFQDMNRTWINKQLPWFFISILIIVLLAIVFLGGNPLEKLNGMYEKQDFSMGQRLLTEVGVVVYYLSLLFFPHPDRLNLIYDFPLSNTLTESPATFAAFAALLMLFIAAIYIAKKHRFYSFAILWFLITLAIESSIIGLEIIYEHRTYLPSIFPVIGLTFLIFRYVRPKALAIAVLCITIGISGFWTFQRNSTWQSALDLWQDNVAKSPLKAAAYVKLSSALMDLGQDETAEKYCFKAIRMDSENAGAYNLLGLIRLKNNQPEKAVPYLTRAVKLIPDDLQYYHNLGVALAESGQTEKAVYVFEEIIDRAPYSPKTFYHLARIRARQNDFGPAAALYKKAILYQPDYVMAFNDLGLVLLLQNNVSEAIVTLEKAVSLNPDYPGAHLNLAHILKQKAPQKAIDHAVRAGILSPEDPRPHILAGEILTALDKIDAAITHYQKAADLRPDNPEILYRMACLYARRSAPDMAAEKLKQAVENGFDDWCRLKSDKDLEKIHRTDYYQSLISGDVQAGGISGKEETGNTKSGRR